MQKQITNQIMRKNKKVFSRRALFFTIDALIAALIMIAGLLLMTSSYVSEQPRTTINHLSHDFMNVLGELQVHEANNTFIQTLVDNGSITNLNNSILVQLGEFWADDRIVLANQFAANVSESILDNIYGYSLAISNETLYSRSNPVTNSLVTSKKIVSGIEKSKPIKGFVSKARATSIQKTTTQTISFSPEGSGWDGSTANPAYVFITKWFNVSPSAVINNATVFISMHIEDDGNDWDVLDLNNGTCQITRDSLGMTEEGYFGSQDISGYINAGLNNAVLQLWNDGYNGHLHPGMYIAINYNVTEDITYLTSERSERIYFDNVLSVEAGGDGSGAWSMVPFHVPPGATNISATLNLNLQDINDIRDRLWWNYIDAWDFRVYVNSDTVFFQDNPAASNDINDCSWNAGACGAEYDWTGNFDITGEIITGTNVVSVYVNNEGDTVGGSGDTLIYSNPIGDPDNSSFVEINYTVTPALPYGVVEIRQVQAFGGAPDPTKDTSFSFPAEAVAISTVFPHIAEQYSYITRVYGDTGTPPGNMVFESPAPRAVPTDVFIPDTLLDVSELAINYVRIDETGGNDVRPESTIDYGFYVPSFVGFGQVFATVTEANDDAVQRLQNVMGSFVNVTDMVLDNTSMSDVPSMWGPSVIEVRVWN